MKTHISRSESGVCKWAEAEKQPTGLLIKSGDDAGRPSRGAYSGPSSHYNANLVRAGSVSFYMKIKVLRCRLRPSDPIIIKSLAAISGFFFVGTVERNSHVWVGGGGAFPPQRVYLHIFAGVPRRRPRMEG